MDTVLNQPAQPGTIPEESAEELFEDAPCGYLTALPDGTIVRANRTFLAWTGYTPDSLLSRRRLQDLLTIPAKVFYETHYGPLLKMQGFIREMALDLICADRSLLPVLVNSREHRDAAGVPLLTRITIFDATERRRYEQELLTARRRAEQLASVVGASGDAILITTAQGEIQIWNRGAARLFGYTPQEATGCLVSDLIVPADGAAAYSRALEEARGGREVQLQTVLVDKGGRSIDVSLSLTPHVEPPGELVAISSIIRDMTERRLVERQLRKAENLQSVGTLAGGVAHEVNNQMTVVLGFGDFVLRALGQNHPQAPDIQSMLSAAERAARISRQLLAFSRKQMIAPQELSLGALLAQVEPRLREVLDPAMTLVLEADDSDALVSADPDQIERILLHLTRNARDAMEAGGQLRISVENAILTHEDARLHPGDGVVAGAYVLVTISDTGSGMDDETLRRAFDPFFTTRPFGEATGLGLATVYGIVKQHGGQVWASSKPDQGTTVRVYLPRADAGAPAVPAPEY
ncbi:MAG: hybrid sensor histidine kinase/response regulator [Geminicoccaceae bacterium]|nr:hybrid sensor histidine kinase/response regulator [Geminicoccaceae bacterium]